MKKKNLAAEPRAYWTPPMEEYLVDILLAEAKEGKSARVVFGKGTGQAAAGKINEKFTPVVTITTKHIRNKVVNLKSKYATHLALTTAEGFSWDGEAITAPEEVWDVYVVTHPGAAIFYDNPWRLYGKLRELFEHIHHRAARPAIPPAPVEPTPAPSPSPPPPPPPPPPAATITKHEPTNDPPPNPFPTPTTSPPDPASKGELAIRALQAAYAHLDDWNMVVAFTLMEDAAKASVFLAMNSGPVRDKWLALQIVHEKFCAELKGAAAGVVGG
ncbi:MAG: hypothetical protein M1839_003794 [Geoglossum umbratile]|nr:MAG: hypothetical protein M1839_003794 [Geoglossum umbratile]